MLLEIFQYALEMFLLGSGGLVAECLPALLQDTHPGFILTPCAGFAEGCGFSTEGVDFALLLLLLLLVFGTFF